MDELIRDIDLRSHILSLPTKADLELFARRKALRQDIEALQSDTAHIGGRVETLETHWELVKPTLQMLTDRCKSQVRRIPIRPDG